MYRKPYMDIIEADNLSKSFGSFKAVHDVSIAVKEGEIFGFLGPNGAGKTTTIRMLTGVLTPDAGFARICGIDIGRNPLEAKLKMGIIPENGTVYSDLTAEQNILWTAKFYGMDSVSRKKRAEEILAMLGLSERRNDIVRTFSKGMRQRISIACAIVPSPPVLFLDEPTGGLDVFSRRLVLDTIRRMNDEGSTIFLDHAQHRGGKRASARSSASSTKAGSWQRAARRDSKRPSIPQNTWRSRSISR